MKNKKRVCVLAPNLAAGGMTRAYMIACAIQHIGYPVRVVGYLPLGQSIYPIPPSNLHIETVSASSYGGLLCNLARVVNDDIVYAIKPRASSFGAALFTRMIRRHRLILDVDDCEPSFYKSKPHLPHLNSKEGFNGYFSSIIRFLRFSSNFKYYNDPNNFYQLQKKVGTVEAVTANTRVMQHKYNAFYLPSAKDTSKFDPNRIDEVAARSALGLSEYKVLMFPGTPRIHKGLEDLLAAIEKLGQPNLKLVIVGGRNEGNSYTNKLLTRWNRWIIRLPQVSSDDMPGIIAAAHVIVIPQRDTLTAHAQFPMKLTDGMAMAKPILSTYVGDIPEIVGDTAYLVKPHSPDAIAHTIKTILQNPQEAYFKGQEARRRCIKHFSFDQIGENLRHILENQCEQIKQQATFNQV